MGSLGFRGEGRGLNNSPDLFPPVPTTMTKKSGIEWVFPCERSLEFPQYMHRVQNFIVEFDNPSHKLRLV